MAKIIRRVATTEETYEPEDEDLDEIEEAADKDEEDGKDEDLDESPKRAARRRR